MTERPDLRAVLEHYDVKIRGTATAMVQCPLHTDNTPSCSVNFNKGLWNCKSCGKGGDSYNLIMEKEGINFVRASELAASLGLTAGCDRGSDDELSGSSFAGGRRLPPRKRDHRKNGKYVPAWKRI